MIGTTSARPKRLEQVDRLLDFFEQNIDPEHIRKIERLNYDVLHLRNVPFLPLTIRAVPEGLDPFPLEEAFDDPEKMLYNELPWVSHLTLEKAREAFAKCVPDFNQTLGEKVVETYHYYHDRLKAYPTTYQTVRITQPEMHSLAKAFEFWKKHRVAIVGWGENEGPDHLDEVYRLGIRSGVQLMAVAENAEQGREIVRRHEQQMAEEPSFASH